MIASPADTTKKPSAAAIQPAEIIHNYAELFESLRVDNIDKLLHYFSDDARFIDPFNDVAGKTAIRQIFADMFEKTDNPHFIVDDIYIKNHHAMLLWTFHLQLKKTAKAITITGCSQVQLNAQGKVCLHKDFWDPCQGLYEHITLLGRLFRWLRSRLAAKTIRN